MTEDEEAGNGADTSPDVGPSLGRDFATRLVSGVALAVVAALVLLAGVIPFSVLVIVVAVLLSWEWARLVHGEDADAVMAVHVVATAAAAVLAAAHLVGLGLLALPIGAILVMLLSLGHNSMFSALGVFYAGLPAIALIWLRSDPVLGLLAVVFVIVMVVVSDTAGFLAGRLVGGPRLWPSVSPNKTWAGFLGALLASAVAGALFWLWVPDGGALHLAVAGALLSLVAQAGDLAESAIKRRFGAKDSSSLIPGHGGVMDRVDGLVAAATAVGLASFVINVHSPARALLLGS
jgi:phosphatidate cytidylyltransferase